MQHNSENSVPNTISLFVLPVMPYPRQHVPFSLPYIDNSSRARCPGEHRLHGASVEAPCLSTSTLTSPDIFPKFSAPTCVASTLRRIWATTSSSKRTKPFKISQKPCTCKRSYDGKPTLKSTKKLRQVLMGDAERAQTKLVYVYSHMFLSCCKRCLLHCANLRTRPDKDSPQTLASPLIPARGHDPKSLSVRTGHP